MMRLIVWTLIFLALGFVGWWYGITVLHVKLAILAVFGLIGILGVFALAIGGAKELIP